MWRKNTLNIQAMQINDFQLLLKLSGYHAGVITEKVKQVLLELRDKGNAVADA